MSIFLHYNNVCSLSFSELFLNLLPTFLFFDYCLINTLSQIKLFSFVKYVPKESWLADNSWC